MIEVCHKQKRQKQIALFFNKDITNVSIITDIDSAINGYWINYEIQLTKVSIV